MSLKLNISHNGKSYKLEVETRVLEGKSVGDKLDGKIFGDKFDGYEFEITGGSDIAGFPMSKNVEGTALKRVLLTRGWGMRSKPRGVRKKKPALVKGLRLRKTVRGKVITDKIVQVNLNVIKEGKKPLLEIFKQSDNK